MTVLPSDTEMSLRPTFRLPALILALAMMVMAGSIRHTARAAVTNTSSILAVSSGNVVKVFNAETGEEIVTIPAIYDTGSPYGTRVATGDMNGDGIAEILTSPFPGLGAASTIKVFDLSGTELTAFRTEAYPAGRWVENVAVGDMTGDGKPDLITADSPNADTEVRIFENRYGESDPIPDSPYRSFIAFPALASNLKTRTTIAFGKGPNGGGGILLSGYDMTQKSAKIEYNGKRFFPFGIAGAMASAAAADVNGDGVLDIIAGFVGASTLSPLEILNGNSEGRSLLTPPMQIYTGNDSFRDLQICTKDVDNDGISELFVGAIGSNHTLGIKRINLQFLPPVITDFLVNNPFGSQSYSIGC